MEDIWHRLMQLDNSLFVQVNQVWTGPVRDQFFSVFTNIHKVWWVQAFVVPTVLGLWAYRHRWRVLRVLLAVGISAGVTDLVCYHGIKSASFRQRPWAVAELQPVLRVPYGPKSSSFPSNHAANTAVMAAVLCWFYPLWWPLFLLYALLTAYSRPYVGVHYPSDALAGLAIGFLIAQLLTRFVFAKFNFFTQARAPAPAKT